MSTSLAAIAFEICTVELRMFHRVTEYVANELATAVVPQIFPCCVDVGEKRLRYSDVDCRFLGRRTGFGHATVLKLCSNNSYAKSDVSRNFATAPSFHADCGGRSVRQAGLIDQPFQASICLRKSISTEPSVCIYFNEGRCACNVCICTKYLRVPSATGPLGRPSKPDVRAQRHRKQSD